MRLRGDDGGGESHGVTSGAGELDRHVHVHCTLALSVFRVVRIVGAHECWGETGPSGRLDAGSGSGALDPSRPPTQGLSEQARSRREPGTLSGLATGELKTGSPRQALDGGIRITGGSSGGGPPTSVMSHRDTAALYDASLGASMDSVATVPPPYAHYSDGSVTGSPSSTRGGGRSGNLPSGGTPE